MLIKGTSTHSSNSLGAEKNQRRVLVTYENERIWVGIWTNKLFPGERSNWSDQNGYLNLPKDSLKLPPGNGREWEWEDIWHVDKSEFTDPDGWQYALDFNSQFHSHKGLFDAVRRRKWVRACRQKTLTSSSDLPTQAINL
jgi:hypothetical protein